MKFGLNYCAQLVINYNFFNQINNGTGKGPFHSINDSAKITMVMKKIIYIKVLLLISFILGVFICPTKVLSQLRFDELYTQIEPAKYLIIYNLKYKEDSNNIDHVRNINMLLMVGVKTSWFIGQGAYQFDTIMKNINNIDEFRLFTSDPNQPRSRFRYKIYKNYPPNKITFIDHIPSTTFRYEEKMDLFNWELQSQVDTILGYKVFNATCDFGGRKWIAWFSPEVPINDGPYKFNGLPGLIFKLYDSQEHYVFNLTEIEEPHNLNIEIKDLDYFQSSKEDYLRASENFREDIISRAREAGLPSKSQQIAAQNMLKRNNPIELSK